MSSSALQLTWKVGFACLYVEARTRPSSMYSEDVWELSQPAPWCFEPFRDHFGIPKESWPYDGFIDSVTKENDPILKGTEAANLTQFKKLRAFLDAFEEAVKSHDSGKLQTVIKIKPAATSGNTYYEGAKIFQDVFAKMWTKAKLSFKIDAKLEEWNGLPWQLATKQGYSWNPAEKVKGKLDPLRDPAKKTIGTASVSHLHPQLMEFLLGPEALSDDLESVLFPLGFLASTVIQQAWDRLLKKGKRMLKVADKMEGDVTNTKNDLMALGKDGNRKEKARLVRKLMAEVQKLKDNKSRFVAGREKEQLNQMEGDMLGIVKFVKGEKDAELTGLGKELEKILETMHDSQTVRELEKAYVETFERVQPTAQQILREVEETGSGWIDEHGDIGVEEFRNSTVDELRGLLGISPNDVRFPYMNQLIHDNALAPSEIKNFDELDNDAGLTEEEAVEKYQLRRLEPDWHQYVGVASAFRRMFRGQNVLLADGVGVGKTLQAFMMMSLVRLYRAQSTDTKAFLPPLVPEDGKLGWRPKSTLPSGHILVIVPTTLAAQWVTEARRFLKNSLWNIFVYPSKRADIPDFWEKLWKAKMEDEATYTILICTYPAIQEDAKVALPDKKARDYGPNQMPDMKPRASQTVFGREWSLVFVDEAHVLRSENQMLRAVYGLRFRTASLVLMTATPLHNAEKDLVSLGIALGVEHVDELIREEKDLAREIGRVNRSKEYSDLDEEIREAARKAIIGEASFSNYYSALNSQGREAAKLLVRRRHVLQMREYLIEYVIRRTAESKRLDGALISGLAAPEIIHIKAAMEPEERREFDAEARRVANVDDTSTSVDLLTNSFFSEYRCRIGCRGIKMGESSYPEYKTLRDFEERSSTKWKLIIKLLMGILRNDEGPFPYVDEDDKLVLPDVNEDPKAKCKVVIYVEFVKTLPALGSALKLHGLDYLECKGSMTPKRRAEVLRKFSDPRVNHRILILSAVGTIGLNLHVAQHLIFADIGWTGQERTQVIGRLHRKPQKNLVHVYLPCIENTTDEILNRMSMTKERLLNIFVGKYDEDEEDEIEDSEESSWSSSQRPKRKAGEPASQVSAKRSRQGSNRSTPSTVPVSSTQTEASGRSDEEADVHTVEPLTALLVEKSSAKVKRRIKTKARASPDFVSMDYDDAPIYDDVDMDTRSGHRDEEARKEHVEDTKTRRGKKTITPKVNRTAITQATPRSVAQPAAKSAVRTTTVQSTARSSSKAAVAGLTPQSQQKRTTTPRDVQTATASSSDDSSDSDSDGSDSGKEQVVLLRPRRRTSSLPYDARDPDIFPECYAISDGRNSYTPEPESSPPTEDSYDMSKKANTSSVLSSEGQSQSNGSKGAAEDEEEDEEEAGSDEDEDGGHSTAQQTHESNKGETKAGDKEESESSDSEEEEPESDEDEDEGQSNDAKITTRQTHESSKGETKAGDKEESESSDSEEDNMPLDKLRPKTGRSGDYDDFGGFDDGGFDYDIAAFDDHIDVQEQKAASAKATTKGKQKQAENALAGPGPTTVEIQRNKQKQVENSCAGPSRVLEDKRKKGGLTAGHMWKLKNKMRPGLEEAPKLTKAAIRGRKRK